MKIHQNEKKTYHFDIPKVQKRDELAITANGNGGPKRKEKSENPAQSAAAFAEKKGSTKAG
ncbi:hypothetical protein RWE15_06730 [Virgibacillus halophilus]|uniref:Small acid-soluble spore protein L (Minor) n=1 Tax=Tigheibacillus halophilus TaxID=361280 RepID=A0ABU5C4K1_9BACI|nr:hypothetical protein [Virgibacillus halophilus]